MSSHPSRNFYLVPVSLQFDRGSLLHLVLLPALRGVRRDDVVGQVVEEEHEAGRGGRHQTGKFAECVNDSVARFV